MKIPHSTHRVRRSGRLVQYAFVVVLFSAAAVAFCAATGVDTTQQAPFPEIFVVNSTGDGDDAFPGDGQCETAVGNGVCTLRAAIEEANAHVGGDGISFSIPTSQPYCDAATVACTIYPTKALPDVSDSVNINGPGTAKLNVVNITGVKFRVFNVTSSGTVSFSNLTIGNVNPFGDSSLGGGIQNASTGTVNISNCTITDNTATGSTISDNGGGIRNGAGTVNVTNSTISGNTASGAVFGGLGGGIYNDSGTVNVSNSTIAFNQAVIPSGSGGITLGGGICNNKGTIVVTNSTLKRNGADHGGGIFNSTNSNGPSNGVVNVAGSTFVANCASYDGGGISSFGGTVNIANSTFYANVTYRNDSDGVFGVGGAVEVAGGTLNLSNSTVTANFAAAAGGGVFSNGTVNVKSTIIASNLGGISSSTESPDVSGAFTSHGFNLIGKKDGSSGFTAATDKKGTIASPLNPKLDVKGLRDNGGPTETVALQSGSPAIDKGTSNGLTGTLTTDQRGFTRTVDRPIANANGGDGTDIGAFEFGAQ